MTVKQDPQGGLAPTPGWSKNSQQRSNGQISSNQAVQNSQLVVSEVATSSNSHANQSASKASGFRFPSRKSQPQAGAEPEQDRRQRSSLLDVSNLGSTGLTTGVRGRSNDNSAASNSSDGPDHLMKAVSAARSSKPGSSSSSSTADADSMMTAVATTRMQSVDLSGGSDSAAGSGSGSNGAQPEYELVYRGQVDLGDAWEGPGRNNVAAKHPKARHCCSVAVVLCGRCKQVQADPLR